MLRLGVNIDHIATIREVRKTQFPDPVQAAVLVELAGADSITVHLRQDRRHIKERDIELLKNTLNIKLNVEIALNKEILDFIVKVKPFSCCLVPERVEEITTEGGLDIIKFSEQVKQTVRTLKKAGIYTAIFIEPEESMIKYAPQCEAEIIELHTGKYADATTPAQIATELSRIQNAAKFAKSLGLEVHAGHGLHYHNVIPIAQIPEIEELNIGHSIISRAMFVGLETAIREMAKLMRR
ncbi:MAG: pyridoxine 5'-phosphate synthase [bacterium]